MSTMHRLAAGLLLAAGIAGSASADELGEVKAQLEQAKQLIRQLEQRLQGLEQQQAGAAPALPAAAAAPSAPTATASPPGGAVIAPSQVPEKNVAQPETARLEVYGFAQADFIYDFNRVDPDWNSTLRPSKIPVNCPGDAGCGKDGETVFSVRQSRLGFKGFLPTAAGELRGKFEFDLFGVGSDAGQTTFRLRHAYGEIGPFLAGQTNSLFMDGDVFPNTIDYWGPNGMIFYRNIQARWTPLNRDGTSLAVALEGPGVGIDNGSTGLSGLSGHNRLPDATAQLRLVRDWGHFQAAGILRSLGYETDGTAGNDPSGTKTGYGLNLSGSIKLGDKNRIMAQVAYGEGISAYINDCCSDLASSSSGEVETLPLLGWLVYYDHYWNERFSSSLGYSMTSQSNSGGQSGSSFHRGHYASANLLYYPFKNVMTGMELLWGKRENNDGESGDDTRLQFSAKYSF